MRWSERAPATGPRSLSLPPFSCKRRAPSVPVAHLVLVRCMSGFSVLRRWPIATSLFILHAVCVSVIYTSWVTSSSIERGMVWMTVFLFDLPSSYLFIDHPGAIGLYACSAIFIGGLQWALIGAFVDMLRRGHQRRQSRRGTPNI